MYTYQKPTKQQVREWQQAPDRKVSPPPTPEQIRRELGWEFKQDRGTR